MVDISDAGSPPARRVRRTRAEARQETRRLLLESAARVIARRGFAGASVERIAEEAGFSIGALYSNFSGKDELLVELMSSVVGTRITEATALIGDEMARPGSSSEDDAATLLGAQLLEVADKEMVDSPLQAELWLYAVRNPEVLERFATRTRETRATVTAMLAGTSARAGQPLSPERADEFATVTIAMFQGLVRLRRIDPTAVSPHLLQNAVHWLLTGLRTKESNAPGDRHT